VKQTKTKEDGPVRDLLDVSEEDIGIPILVDVSRDINQAVARLPDCRVYLSKEPSFVKIIG